MKQLFLTAMIVLGMSGVASAEDAVPKVLFGQVIAATKVKYENASTEIQKTYMRSLRKEAICSLNTLNVVNWDGIVIDVKSNNEGMAGLAVDMGDFKLVPFDGFFGDTNFVKASHPTYGSLLNLKRGDHVYFHGAFKKGSRDCFREMSLTERGSMTMPEFMFDFTAITKN